MCTVGDYLIIELVQGKKALAKCVVANKDSKKYKAVLETDTTKGGDNAPFEFNRKAIIANLGKSPSVGSVYGIKIEPLRERIDSSFWGEVHIYADLDDGQKKQLQKGMKEVREGLKKWNVPQLPLITEIRTLQGKQAGMYKYRRNADNDVLIVKPDEELSDLPYYFGHEYAHGIWYRNFTPKMRMAWVKMYHEGLTLNEVTTEQLDQMLEDLKTNGDVNGYFKELDDEGKQIYRAIFRHIKQVHGIEKQHVALALILGEDIDQYWPESLEISEKQVIITDYAKKSPEELWAEAFGHKFAGKKLPKKVDDLLDKCMRSLKK